MIKVQDSIFKNKGSAGGGRGMEQGETQADGNCW